MEHGQSVAAADVARHLAHPLRLQLLSHTSDAGPCTFSELADAVDASPAQVSNHLKLLRDAGLVVTRRVGRQSFYRAENSYVGEILANLSALIDSTSQASTDDRDVATVGPRPHAQARRCYDHIGGRLGVDILRLLCESGGLAGAVVDHGELDPGPALSRVLSRFRVQIPAGPAVQRRRFAYACPDWTERTPHLGGALGAEIRRQLEANGWLERREGTRALALTRAGSRALGTRGVRLA